MFRPYDDNQRLALMAKRKRIAVLGNNRSGKTTIGAVRVASHFTGYYPQDFPEEMKSKQPCRIRILIQDYREHGKVMENKLREWIPPKFVKRWVKNNQGYLVGVQGTNDSYISILTHEQPTMAHEGWDGHVVWADEPCPKEKFIANIRGLIDHNGEYFTTLTPLSEPWLSDEIYEENPDLWDVIQLDSRQNPHVDQKALHEFWRSVDEHELIARREGKFMHLAGSVYPNFNSNIHVVEPRIIPRHWPRFCVCDPHDRRPFALAWFAVDETDRIWWYDEYPDDRMFHKISSTTLKINDFATIIRNKEGRDNICRRIIDARYGPRRSAITNTSILEQFGEFGLYFDTSYGDEGGNVEAGHIIVKEYFGKEGQEPKMFFFKTCKNLIYAMTHYTYDEKTGKPKEHAKDFADLVRYGAADKPRFEVWQDQGQPKQVQREGISGYGE